MQADLFSARDAAALLAIRQAIDDRRLSGAQLLAAFAASGLMRAADESSTATLAGIDAGSSGPVKRAA